MSRSAPPSRLSNGSNPANGDSGPDGGDREHRPDVPTPEERVRELLDAHPDRAYAPVSTRHGEKLRPEALDRPETVERTIETGEHDEKTVEETVRRDALPLVAVVEEFLNWYEGYRNKWLRMARREWWTVDPETFEIPLENSFAPEYQKRQYARLQALERQTIGGEFPTGEGTAGEFDQPVTVMFSLTSSGRDGDDLRPPVDHDREIRDAWSGSDGVRRTLRHVLSYRLGLSSDEYAWWFQSEPHPGDGINAGLSHAHPVLVLDGAAADVPLDAIDAETFRPVVAKHVAECPYARHDAHPIDHPDPEKRAVSVRKPDEMESFAGYVSEYVAVSPDEDLLERSIEYIMWAAAQWARPTQKYSKSRTATAAIDADRCHQQYADPDADQDHDHGEEVVRVSRASGYEYQCAACGSVWGVEQNHDTLTAARLAGGGETGEGASGSVATDGGTDAASGLPPLEERWRDARAAGAAGGPVVERECDHPDASNQCPLCAEYEGAVAADVPIPETATAPDVPVSSSEGFRRPAEWEPDAIVQKRPGDDDETPIGAPGGTAYGEVVVPGAESAAAQLEELGATHLPPPDMFAGPEPWRGGPAWFTESAVRDGKVPPPEIVAREYAEYNERGYDDGAITPKRWAADWYATRFEVVDDGDGADGPPLDEAEREAVRRYVDAHPDAEAVQVLGALCLDPDALGWVRVSVA